MSKVLNDKCRRCSMCSEVTHTITGAPIPNTKYQCLADIEPDCLGDEDMMIEVDNTDKIKKAREYFEYQWNNGGGFMRKLCDTITSADVSNLKRLHKAFPELVEGYIAYGTGKTWDEFIR